MSKTVLSVGQCGMDHASISGLCGQFGANLINISSAKSLFEYLKGTSADLILVNRILDSDGDSGLEIIRKLKEDSNSKYIPVMLVSNYEDAQSEAVSYGALPGFGKNDLGLNITIDKLRKALNQADNYRQH